MVETTSVRGEVTFEALGKTWRLKLGHAAYEQIEIETGKRFNVLMKMYDDDSTLVMGLIRIMFKHGLHRFHGDLDPMLISDIIDDVGIKNANGLIASAIYASARKDSPNEEAPQDETKN